MAQPIRLILIRHGQSQWNLENRFTGWADVDLTEEGAQQMRDAAVALCQAGLRFDIAYTSMLRRCIRSQWILLDAMDRMWLPQVCDWRLNERHYGALTGLLKADAERIHGAAKVQQWRRSYEACPPPLMADDHAFARLDERYGALGPSQFPLAESLKQTVERVLPLWEMTLVPILKAGKQVLITAHGNSLRALIKHLDGMADRDVVALEVPNAVPLVYELDQDLVPIHRTWLAVPPRSASGIL